MPQNWIFDFVLEIIVEETDRQIAAIQSERTLHRDGDRLRLENNKGDEGGNGNGGEFDVRSEGERKNRKPRPDRWSKMLVNMNVKLVLKEDWAWDII